MDDEDFDLVSHLTWRATTCTYKGKTWTYAISQLSGRKPVLMHRLLAKATRGKIVDHANGNTLDNRKANLRQCTHAENMRNRDASRFSASGLKGVHKKGSRWRAEIYLNGKAKHLGIFDDPKEASVAYQAAAVALHKEFARF